MRSTVQEKPSTLTAEEARGIAKEAYIYGFPLVDNYRIQYSYFVDTSNKEYKAPWNQLYNNARVYTPDDKAVQTPNSDTPYSFVGVDLRSQPIVVSVPQVEAGRYFSLQFIDMYTFNFAYVGSRATGNDAGSYLLAGPGWKGEKPAGVKQVIHAETDFAFVLYRTQLFSVDDIENVKKIQAGYKVQALSDFLKQPPPPQAPVVNFIAPLTPEEQRTSPRFFSILDFVLQFCPTHPSEKELMARFGKIGIGPQKNASISALPAEIQKSLTQGMADPWVTFKEYKASELDTGKKSSADAFGTREKLNGSYIDRMCAAALGIYGNSKDEAIYPAYFVDAQGKSLDATSNHYKLRFPSGQLPPVNAFWSLTLYELPSSLLSRNPLNRYLINSTMLPELEKDADGGITLFIQSESPGAGYESNWLSAPAGPFFCVMRLYWPKKEALDGLWKSPPLERVL